MGPSEIRVEEGHPHFIFFPLNAVNSNNDHRCDKEAFIFAANHSSLPERFLGDQIAPRHGGRWGLELELSFCNRNLTTPFPDLKPLGSLPLHQRYCSMFLFQVLLTLELRI